MTEPLTKREQIVRELIRRVKAGFPRSKYDRGFHEEDVTVYDHFYFFDLIETIGRPSTRTRGLQERSLPVSISYWFQTDPKLMYQRGNEYLGQIQTSVELDEYFGSPEVGGNLCIRYWLEEAGLVWYDEGVMDVELLYTFDYVQEQTWVRRPFNHPDLTKQGG